jgi:hypothetical protein
MSSFVTRTAADASRAHQTTLGAYNKQETGSLDGRRLTVLMEPGRIKRGLGADPSHAVCEDEIGVLTLQERSLRRVCQSHRTEPRRGSSRATRGAPGRTASSSLNVSKTFAATGWARLWTMTWARVDHRGPG